MRFRPLSIAFSLASAFCAPSALADTDLCARIWTSEFALGGRLEVTNEALQKGVRAEDFAKTILTLQTLLKPLEIPTESDVVIHQDYKKSRFNHGTFQVHVGLHPDTGLRLHPKFNQALLAHEYGHAIFEKNLKKTSERYRSLVEDMLQNAPEIQENPGKFSSLLRDWSLSGAFHEFFGDFIVLLSTKDPRAIQHLTLERSKAPQKHSVDELKLRNFAAGRHHLNRQRWNKAQRLQVKMMGDIYLALMPARWELWNIIKKKMEGDQYRQELAAKVFAILERHLSKALYENSQNPKAKRFENIEEMNQQIMADFRQEL